MDVFALNHVNGILEAALNVFSLESRIVVPNNRLWQDAVTNQFQDGLNGNSSAGYARFAEMNFMADLDSTHAVKIHLRAPQRQG
jgi:hypothetical protein